MKGRDVVNRYISNQIMKGYMSFGLHAQFKFIRNWLQWYRSVAKNFSTQGGIILCWDWYKVSALKTHETFSKWALSKNKLIVKLYVKSPDVYRIYNVFANK